jgi:hypothetical protein
MSNHLPNGTVLPHGLLGVDVGAAMGAFNKAYKNTQFRMGIVIKSYAYDDPDNFSGLTTEYDVVVLEQNENVSYTNITYRNCLASEGMGSIADYFEKNLRVQTQNNNAQGAVNTTNQNGAIVTLLCLDGFREKAIIVGGLTHPDRQTELASSAPQLYGEYNGVAVQINPDGSTSLTFNGATDNNGDLVTPGQGPTTVAIATDGSFSVQHSAVTVQLEKNGVVNITATGNINVNTPANANVTAANVNITASDKIVESAKEIDLNGNSGDPGRGVTSSNSHMGVIDLITGVPVEPSTTVFIDV